MPKEISNLDYHSVRQLRTSSPCPNFKWGNTYVSSFCLGLVLLGSFAYAAQEDVYFGVVTDGQTGNPFLGFYANGQFMARQPEWSGDEKKYLKQIADITSRFPIGRQLDGLTLQGQTRHVVIERVLAPSGDLGDTLFGFRTEPNTSHGKLESQVTLFWTKNIVVRRLQPAIGHLDSESENRLRVEAVELWKRAQTERSPEDQAKNIKFGSPVVQQVKEAADIAAILFPAVEDHGQGRTDDRASAFFIYDLKKRKTIFGTLGHPEWSPNAKMILGLKPLIYFKIEGDSNILLLTEYTSGWEDVGRYAILDLRTGKALLKSF